MTKPDAAVAIVHARGAAESVLLMRRTEREADAWSGHWSFPGGRWEAGDGDLLHTALRELEEECGIRLGEDSLEAALAPAVARRKVGRFLVVAPFVLRTGAELPVVLGEEEAVEAVWVPLSLLRDAGQHAMRRVPGLPAEVRFPAIDLNGVPLWGFTYRLMMEWLGLCAPEASREAAEAVLRAVVESGCVLERGFGDGKEAVVRGAIAVAAVLARVGALAGIPQMNMLEVTGDAVQVVGLGLEEYWIKARLREREPRRSS